jgi:hypothetical protein
MSRVGKWRSNIAETPFLLIVIGLVIILPELRYHLHDGKLPAAANSRGTKSARKPAKHDTRRRLAI